jgi:hypothetical protein
MEEMTEGESPTQSTQDEMQQDSALQQAIQLKTSSYRHHFSIYHRNGTPISQTQLNLFRSFANSIKSADNQAHILPICNDKHMLSLTTTDQINKIDMMSIQKKFELYKRTTKTLSGDFHISSTLPFDELKHHIKVSNWFELNGYNITLCECQSSDMVKVGFLSRVRGFTYRDDLHTFITDHPLWVQDPFYFRLYFDSFATKICGKTNYVLMIDVDRPNVEKGISFLEQLVDGIQKNSSYAIAYPFFPLYKNTYSNEEQAKIISDCDSHTDNISVVTLYGLNDMDTKVRLRNNVLTPLWYLLLSIPCPGTTNGKCFLQVERQSGSDWLLCAFVSIDSSEVMTKVPMLSEILQCYVLQEDMDNIFRASDKVLKLNGQAMPARKGRLHIPLLPTPESTLEHTRKVLSVITPQASKRIRSEVEASPHQLSLGQTLCPSSTHRQHTSVLNSPITTTTSEGTDMEDTENNMVHADLPPANHDSSVLLAPLTNTELSRRFQLIELEFQRSDTRLTKLETICTNVAQTNTDISSQLKEITFLVNKLAHTSPRRTINARVFPEVEDEDGIDLSIGLET